MKNEKISIIIPVYNTEKYVEKSINSILNQSYKNIELIIINDGSTDNSEKIIKRIMAQKYLYNYSINRILEDCDISLYSYYQFIKIGENIFLKNIEKELCYNTNYEKT